MYLITCNLIFFSFLKYTYSRQDSGTFSVGSIGVEDSDCPSLEFTYVRLAADDLDHWLSGEIHGFASSLCQQGVEHTSGKVMIPYCKTLLLNLKINYKVFVSTFW